MTCRLRLEPIGVQVQAARARLAMVPTELRRKRTSPIQRLAPSGQAWCAGCQSFRDSEDFGKGQTQCKPCASASQHAAMTERTYGLTADQYDALLERQGGKCAICRARPVSKRLAVDHDHKSGVVRGLLCSRCNHDLMGSAWDSLAIAEALWRYLNAPPATGTWVAPEGAPTLLESTEPRGRDRGTDIVATRSGKAPGKEADAAACTREHFVFSGSEPVPGKKGIWRYWVSDRPDTDPPF